MIRIVLRKLPWALVLSRLIAGPLLILWVVIGKPSPAALLALLAFGILSDIFDGIIARSLNVATTALRRFDSQADFAFWVCVLIALWIHRPALVSEHRVTFIVLLSLEALCYLISFLRFRKETCTHAISAKIYGLSIFCALGSMLAFGIAGIPLRATLVLGLVANFDVVAIILLLPSWGSDIPSAYHAWRIRRGLPITRYRIFN